MFSWYPRYVVGGALFVWVSVFPQGRYKSPGSWIWEVLPVMAIAMVTVILVQGLALPDDFTTLEKFGAKFLFGVVLLSAVTIPGFMGFLLGFIRVQQKSGISRAMACWKKSRPT